VPRNKNYAQIAQNRGEKAAKKSLQKFDLKKKLSP